MVLPFATHFVLLQNNTFFDRDRQMVIQTPFLKVFLCLVDLKRYV